MLEQTISASTEPAEQENEVNHNMGQEKQEQAGARFRKYDKNYTSSQQLESSASSGETNIRAHSVIYSSRLLPELQNEKMEYFKEMQKRDHEIPTNFESKRSWKRSTT